MLYSISNHAGYSGNDWGTTMICKNCGAELTDDALFCSRCGARTELPGEAVTGIREREETAENVAEGVMESVSTMPAPENVKIADVPVSAPELETVEEKVAAAVAAATPAYTVPVTEPIHIPEAPVEEPKPETERAPKAPVKGSVGRILLSILLSILLCASLLVSSLVTVLRLSVTGENLTGAVGNIELSSVKLGNLRENGRAGSAERSAAKAPAAAETLGVAVMTGGTRAAGTVSSWNTGLDDMEDLAGYLYDMAKNQPGWEDVRREDIEEALDSDLVDEFLREMVSDYADVIVKGKDGKGMGLTPDNITDFVMAHEDEIRKIVEDAGYKGEFRLDGEKLRQAISDSLGDTYAPEKIVREHSRYVDILRIVVSLPVVIILWVITAGLVVLIIVVNKRRISAALSCVGIPALIVGLLYLVCWSAMTIVPTLRKGLWSLIPAFLGRDVLLTGACLAGGGLLLIIVKAVIRSVQKKRRSKKAI